MEPNKWHHVRTSYFFYDPKYCDGVVNVSPPPQARDGKMNADRKSVV